MKPLAETVFTLLLQGPERVAVVGTGSQAQAMRALLSARFRIATALIPGASSAEVALGHTAYLLCATPKEAATQTLVGRGVPAAAILPWPLLLAELEAVEAPLLRRTAGLDALDQQQRDLLHDQPNAGLADLVQRCAGELRQRLLAPLPWDTTTCVVLEQLAVAYLACRRLWARLHSLPLRRLLFPSPGRCGGVSLTNALSHHPRLHLRVDHEGQSRAIYQALATLRQGRLGPAVLAALASTMLDEADCLGGNPFCFLLPYLRDLPWFECHVLKVERPAAELRESIVQRNFHYSPADFVPERVTGADWGTMTADACSALPLEAKVDWYLATVDAEIERGAGGCTVFHRVPLANLLAGLNFVLDGLRWPRLAALPHLNSLPKDRVLSYDERARLFLAQRAAESTPPSA